MTALKKTLSKSWIAAAAAGALFASLALPAEAGGHDRFHHGHGGHQGGHQGFHGQQIQRRQMPHIPRQPQIQQRQPHFNRAPHMRQQFNRAPDPRIHRMQNQVRRMQIETRQMQQMAIQRRHMIEQQRLRLQRQWRQERREEQWQQRRYYNPGIYGAPVYRGPTQEDYNACLEVQQESNGCFIDNNGGIHYIQQRFERDNGAGVAARILLETIETIKDLSQREQLQKQLLELEQKKKALEAQRDEAAAKQGAQAIPEPTVETGELEDDTAQDTPDQPKPAAPKP
jgi:hypothetical protein